MNNIFNWWVPLALCAAMIALGFWLGWMMRGGVELRLLRKGQR